MYAMMQVMRSSLGGRLPTYSLRPSSFYIIYRPMELPMDIKSIVCIIRVGSFSKNLPSISRPVKKQSLMLRSLDAALNPIKTVYLTCQVLTKLGPPAGLDSRLHQLSQVWKRLDWCLALVSPIPFNKVIKALTWKA